MNSLSDGDPCISFGKGSYSIVKGYRNRLSKNLFALKLSSNVKNAENEQLILTHLQNGSPFIVQFYNSFLDCSRKDKEKGFLCLCLEACIGGTLHQHIARGSLSEEQCRLYSSELLSTLLFLQEHLCIHRDIKANNCLLTSNGHLKLVDFGNAIILNHASDRTFTILGSYHHLAPEMIAGMGYNMSVDWWSTGVVWYEMLTGSLPPFQWFEPSLHPTSTSPQTISISNKQKQLALNAIEGREYASKDWDLQSVNTFVIPDIDTIPAPQSIDIDALVAYHMAKENARWQGQFLTIIYTMLMINPTQRLLQCSDNNHNHNNNSSWFHEEILHHPECIYAKDSSYRVEFDTSIGFMDIIDGTESDGVGDCVGNSCFGNVEEEKDVFATF